MKKLNSIFALLLFATVFMISFCSCEKDDQIIPDVVKPPVDTPVKPPVVYNTDWTGRMSGKYVGTLTIATNFPEKASFTISKLSKHIITYGSVNLQFSVICTKVFDGDTISFLMCAKQTFDDNYVYYGMKDIVYKNISCDGYFSAKTGDLKLAFWYKHNEELCRYFLEGNQL